MRGRQTLVAKSLAALLACWPGREGRLGGVEAACVTCCCTLWLPAWPAFLGTKQLTTSRHAASCSLCSPCKRLLLPS